jgi:hypothetical protein
MPDEAFRALEEAYAGRAYGLVFLTGFDPIHSDEAACGADLPLKAMRAQRGGQLGMEDLQGDRAVVLQVLGQVDAGHPTAPELLLERVVVGQCGLQPF